MTALELTYWMLSLFGVSVIIDLAARRKQKRRRGNMAAFRAG